MPQIDPGIINETSDPYQITFEDDIVKVNPKDSKEPQKSKSIKPEDSKPDKPYSNQENNKKDKDKIITKDLIIKVTG